MEWESPAIGLVARPFGETDLIATLFTEEQGVVRGLVKGGASRSKAAVFQPGNIMKATWTGRLADQLGHFAAEIVHPAAAAAMASRVSLTMLQSIAAVTSGALPERDPYPALFRSLLLLMVRLPEGEALIADIVRYECALLAALGYGLRFPEDAAAFPMPAFVSPRTGRVVGEEEAGAWRERLLPMPEFLLRDVSATREDELAGLSLSGHFLARDVFGTLNRPLPAERQMLYDLIVSFEPSAAAD